MPQRLAHVTLLVRNYDEAIAFYTTVLGFTLASDLDLGDGKRWVVVAPPGPAGGCGLLLAEAKTDQEKQAVGQQGAGRVWLFLHTDDFWRDYPVLQARGLRFLEAPRSVRCTATLPCSKTCTATSGTCWSRWAERQEKQSKGRHASVAALARCAKRVSGSERAIAQS